MTAEEQRVADAWDVLCQISYEWLQRHLAVIHEDAEAGCQASELVLRVLKSYDDAETDAEFAHIVSHVEEAD